MTRYEAYLAVGQEVEPFYSIWLGERIDEWAASGRRGEEIARERREGWQFPGLRSERDHREFDEWLERYVNSFKEVRDVSTN